MTELDATRWVQDQPGLKLVVGKDREITITNGVTVEVKAIGILAAVIEIQKILKTMTDNIS